MDIPQVRLFTPMLINHQRVVLPVYGIQVKYDVPWLFATRLGHVGGKLLQ